MPVCILRCLHEQIWGVAEWLVLPPKLQGGPLHQQNKVKLAKCEGKKEFLNLVLPEDPYVHVLRSPMLGQTYKAMGCLGGARAFD